MDYKGLEAYVYYDDYLHGHAFIYYVPRTKKVLVSDGVYDREEDARKSAWLCCFGHDHELEDAGFQREAHCKTVSIH